MIERYNVIGNQISRQTMSGALDAVVQRIQAGDGGYVCFTNVHVSVMARENTNIQNIINHSFMTLPDGKPVYWVGKLKGLDSLEQVPGPDFFPQLLKTQTEPSLRHYFFGGSQQTLDELVSTVKKNYPGAVIAGSESPPFRELSHAEIEASLQRIKDSKANVVWVGLGAPKQEKWMADHWKTLKPAVLFGVGAAFDFHAGNIQRAPLWAQRLGLEWLHRLLSEPRRLWKRYFYTNTMFLFYLLKEQLGFERK